MQTSVILSIINPIHKQGVQCLIKKKALGKVQTEPNLICDQDSVITRDKSSTKDGRQQPQKFLITPS